MRGEPIGRAGGLEPREGPSPRDRRAKAQVGRAGPGLARGRRRRRAAAKAVNRNGKRLLVYVLDVAATLAQNQVVIDLARRQRKTTGEWGPLRPWYYAPRAAHVKYDPEDRLILALLDEAQGNPTHAGYGSPSRASASGTAAVPARAAGAAGPRSAPSRPTGPAGRRRPTARRRRGRRPSGPAGHAAVRAAQGPGGAGGAAGADRPAAAAAHRGRGRPADGALGRRPALAVRAGRPLRGRAASAGRGAARSAAATRRMDLSEPLVLLPGLLILGVGRAARFDDLGVMPWIVRLRYEKEITFVEPQQDLMLGRILAETRVPPPELVETLNLEEIDVKPRPCLTLRTPRQNWGLGADKLIGELEFDYDGAVIPAGRTTPLAVSTELGLVDPPRPEDRERRRRQALRAGLPRGEGPAAGPRHARAARQADGAGDQGPGRRRLAGRGRGQADPPGRRVQAGRVHRHRLVRARRRRRLRRPARQPARPAGRRPPRRDR